MRRTDESTSLSVVAGGLHVAELGRSHSSVLGSRGMMRYIGTEEEKDMVGSILCEQLYQTRACKFLQNIVNTCGSDA